MRPLHILLALALAGLIALPFALRTSAEGPDASARTLIVVTPHVQQIQDEFARAFDAWHRREYGQAVRIDWRKPGGTSEIIKQLSAQFTAAANDGAFDAQTLACERGTIAVDIMLGGGTYDHGKLKRGVQVDLGGNPVTVPMSVPPAPPFGDDRLDAWFGDRPHSIGRSPLYDPQQFWLGTALSSFGIVFNREVLATRLHVTEPRTFDDLTSPEYFGELALADPRGSGSITTTFESILDNYGWDEGWRILRVMGANARSFSNASTRPPIDVAQGEAAAGLAIDFYGRSQAQASMRPGDTAETARVGYVDPESVWIDPDPVSIIRGGPDPELARRFVEFCLCDEAQVLWQFHATGSSAGHDNPLGPDGEPLGPRTYELRRMPVRPALYADRFSRHFVDRIRPFEVASTVPSRGWRDAIAPIMAASAIDNADELRRAWRAVLGARSAADSSADELARLVLSMPRGDRVAELWRELFDDGDVPAPTGAFVDFTPENFASIRPFLRDARVAPRLQIIYTRIFRENYARAVELAKSL